MKYIGTIIEKDSYKHSNKTSNGTAEIINKFKNEIFEVNLYILNPNENFFFRPPSDGRSIKTYYILEGSLYNYDTKKSYTVGDMVVLDANSDPFSLKAESILKVLVQSVFDSSYNQSNETFRIITETLTKIQEKDAYTSEHSHRVYELTRLMGLELNYTGQKLRNLLYAAKCHDVGKVYIDDEILNKPTQLTDDEYETMKTHVVMGKELIIFSFNEDTYTITSQHHERNDGSGYPFGLMENDIMEESKILAICDSFDAMTTDRIYKKGKSIEAAVRELKAQSKTKYDETLVNIFINHVLTKV